VLSSVELRIVSCWPGRDVGNKDDVTKAWFNEGKLFKINVACAFVSH
jgi:hypothetical protein